MLSRNVLILAAMDGADECALRLSDLIGSKVQITGDRKMGLKALRSNDWGVLVVDESLTGADPAWADTVWESAGLAMPIQLNFAISGFGRLGREVKAVLHRRDAEEVLARRAARSELENDLKSTVTGLLLQIELALREAALPGGLQTKLRAMQTLTLALGDRLGGGTER